MGCEILDGLLAAANAETDKANKLIDELRHERNVLQKICAERSDHIIKLQKVVAAARKTTCGPKNRIPTCDYLCLSDAKALCVALAELEEWEDATNYNVSP
jgi:hypothetical protein